MKSVHCPRAKACLAPTVRTDRPFAPTERKNCETPSCQVCRAQAKTTATMTGPRAGEPTLAGRISTFQHMEGWPVLTAAWNSWTSDLRCTLTRRRTDASSVARGWVVSQRLPNIEHRARLVMTASSGSFGFQGPEIRLIGSVQQFWLSIGGCDGRQWGWKT